MYVFMSCDVMLVIILAVSVIVEQHAGNCIAYSLYTYTL